MAFSWADLQLRVQARAAAQMGGPRPESRESNDIENKNQRGDLAIPLTMRPRGMVHFPWRPAISARPLTPVPRFFSTADLCRNVQACGSSGSTAAALLEKESGTPMVSDSDSSDC